MQRKLVIIGLALSLVVCCLTGCNVAPTVPQPTEAPVAAGKITFAGSTTLQPLAHELGEAFTEKYPDVELDIAAGGSTVGIRAIHDGTVDIGMASRSLKPEEEEGVEQHQVAVDVIALVLHTSNPVENLSVEQLRDIYLGEITNWREVGGDDESILVIARGKNSGTRGAFDKIVLDKEDPAAPGLKEAVTAGDMAAMVADNANSIGYVGFGNLEPDIKMITIDGVVPSEETARDGSYPLTRPLLFLTGPLTQPLAFDFIEFALSPDGQQLVVDSGWVPAK